MTFWEGFKDYYNTMLMSGLVPFFSSFMVAFGFCVLLWPKVFSKKEILKLVAVFVISYSLCIAFTWFMCAFGNVLNKLIIKTDSGLPKDKWVRNLSIAFSLPIIILTFCLIFFRDGKLHHYIKTITLISSIVVIEVLFKNITYFSDTLHVLKPFKIIFGTLPYALFIGVCYLLKRIDINHYRHLSQEMVIIISVLSTLLIVAGVYEQISMVDDPSTTVLLSVLDIVLLFVLNFSYYATYKNIEHRHRITNLEVQKTLEEAEKMSIAIDKTNREELEKIRHDIKNQFSYINAMLQQGKYEEAKKYIDDYLNTSEVLYSFSCSNNVINSIINLELTKAKISKIKIDAKVVVPPHLPFKDSDLVSLLTNMIDNALENYYSESKDAVVVRIMKQNDFIRFIVSNPVNMEKINMRSLTTTRKTGRGHGYGTRIIKNIATTYNGYVDFNVEDNRFVCDAVLNLNIKEE